MNLLKKLRSFRREESGASLAEYAVLLVILGVVGVATITGLGTAIQNRLIAGTQAVNGVTPAP